VALVDVDLWHRELEDEAWDLVWSRSVEFGQLRGIGRFLRRRVGL